MDYITRRALELEEITKRLNNDSVLKRELNKIHTRASNEIARTIDADLQYLARSGGMSMTEARKVASRFDVVAFQEMAKRYVETRDFTQEANAALRKYNVTMRTSRLGVMKARINLITTDLADAEGKMIQNNVEYSYIKEYERQSAILGITTPTQAELRRRARAVALSDVSGANFSERIWRDQRELTRVINRQIERTIIHGGNPLESMSELKRLTREKVDAKAYKARRIAVTETARAQSIAQVESFEDADIEEYVWITETDACSDCEDNAAMTFKVGDFRIGLNAVPLHPNCRCSIAANI